MTRTIRHPYQVLEVAEMVVGQPYAFVQIFRTGKTDYISHYTMGGVILETLAAHDLKVDMLLADPPAGPTVTVHMDGWRPVSTASAPTVMYWAPTLYWEGSRIPWKSRTDMGWSMLSTWLGPVFPKTKNGEYHCIIVPAQRWDNDPRLHVTDWDNPDTVIKRLLDTNNVSVGSRPRR